MNMAEPVVTPVIAPVIAVEGLAKVWGGRTVVRDVSITLARGAMLGLVGANGGGKTTTLRMLVGLVKPDAGQGFVLGENVRGRAAARRARIGYMGQRLALYPDLTVAENLAFRAGVHGLSHPKQGVADVVARYGLGDVQRQRFGQLSGGWARRVQFAASVIHAPPLLLLDEPTAGLDVATKRDIWRWLNTLAAAGCAIIISTHDLAEAEHCPVIILYQSGIAHPAMTPAGFMAEEGADSLEAAVLNRALVR